MTLLASAKLVPNPFLASVPRKATRDGFGLGVVAAGKADDRVVVLSADLTESTRVQAFHDAFPERFVQLGVSEQSLAAIASGMALAGSIPFIASYAVFSPGRNWEQIRTTACLQNIPLKIVGNHAGISVGPDGATHQMTEDIALMRVLPNMIVLSPCDAIEAEKATIAAATINGPVYIRLSREPSPVFTTKRTPFVVGKASVLAKGTDIALIATGPLVFEVLKAARDLEKRGIHARVINVSTIKPLDTETIIAAAKECGTIITIEEAQIAGGLGGAVCEAVSAAHPVPVLRMGMQDEFGQSGTAAELYEHYHLTAPWIVKEVVRMVKR